MNVIEQNNEDDPLPRRKFRVTGLKGTSPFIGVSKHPKLPKLNSRTWDRMPGWRLCRVEVKPFSNTKADVICFYEAPAK